MYQLSIYSKVTFKKIGTLFIGRKSGHGRGKGREKSNLNLLKKRLNITCPLIFFTLAHLQKGIYKPLHV